MSPPRLLLSPLVSLPTLRPQPITFSLEQSQAVLPPEPPVPAAAAPPAAPLAADGEAEDAAGKRLRPAARRVAVMARVIRRGQKLGAFVDDTLLDVEVDQHTRIVKGRRTQPAQVADHRKSFGERMFPRLASVDVEATDNADNHGNDSNDDENDTGPQRYSDLEIRHPSMSGRKMANLMQQAALLTNELEVVRKGPADEPWMHGPITREETERLLTKAAATYPHQADGLYLVRTGTKKAGSYVISLWADSKVHHYLFKSLEDGFVLKGKFFPACSMVQLLEHFKIDDDVGLATELTHYVNKAGVVTELAALNSDV